MDQNFLFLLEYFSPEILVEYPDKFLTSYIVRKTPLRDKNGVCIVPLQ